MQIHTTTSIHLIDSRLRAEAYEGRKDAGYVTLHATGETLARFVIHMPSFAAAKAYAKAINTVNDQLEPKLEAA